MITIYSKVISIIQTILYEQQYSHNAIQRYLKKQLKARQVSFKQLAKSYSSSIVLGRAIIDKKSYFLKIYSINNSRANLDQIFNEYTNTYQIHQSFQLNIPKLIYCMPYGKHCVCLLYEWIDGENLWSLHPLQKTKLYSFTYDIGCHYQSMFVSTPPLLRPKSDAFSYLQDGLTQSISKIQTAREQFPQAYDKYLTKKEEKQLFDLAASLLTSFDNEPMGYIHGDLTGNNIMVTKHNQLYMVDLESFRVDFFVMNFIWIVTYLFNSQPIGPFYKGLLDGFYAYKVPDSFFRELVFLYLFRSFHHLGSLKDENQIQIYLQNFKTILTKYHLLDISLDKTLFILRQQFQ
ncbi:MAG: phosphotransferase [Solobacterium sp.]|nr:phosphotransferase [Solobacterium sp.]